MAKHYKLYLSDAEKEELQRARDHHPKPYIRTRAAAILKVAAGQSIRQVALYGLLWPYEPEAVKDWIDRYRSEGLSGLTVRPGRGRKPAFSPSEPGGGEGRSSGASPPIAQAVRHSPDTVAPPGCRSSPQLVEGGK